MQLSVSLFEKHLDQGLADEFLDREISGISTLSEFSQHLIDMGKYGDWENLIEIAASEGYIDLTSVIKTALSMVNDPITKHALEWNLDCIRNRVEDLDTHPDTLHLAYELEQRYPEEYQEAIIQKLHDLYVS